MKNMADEDDKKDQSAPINQEAPADQQEAKVTDAASADQSLNLDGAAANPDEALDLDEDLAKALSQSEGPEGANQEVDVDAVIAEKDPSFGEEMAGIDNSSFKGVVIDSERVSEEVDENQKAPSIFKTWLTNLPKELKTRYAIAAAIVFTLIPLAILIYNGKILPSFELPYHVSMLELTDEYYSYNTEDPYVPLFDEYRTKSFTMSLPRTVINLLSQSDQPVYGEFEFFLNLREKDLQKKIKENESEILDLLQRVLERVSWEDLQSPVGKERVKKMVRYRLNEYLQGNMVIGVYYRTILVRK